MRSSTLLVMLLHRAVGSSFEASGPFRSKSAVLALVATRVQVGLFPVSEKVVPVFKSGKEMRHRLNPASQKRAKEKRNGSRLTLRV